MEESACAGAAENGRSSSAVARDRREIEGCHARCATSISLGVPLSPKGIASITTIALTTGDHTIEARYAGSTTDRPSHAAMIQHVN